MIGELKDEEMEALLKQQIVGRIACSHGEFIYLVPMSYAYDGQYIYGRSFEGVKLDIMRKNPNICFEVDNVADMADWQSVIVWGKFEELKEPGEREKALRALVQRHLPLRSSITMHLGKAWPFSEHDLEDITGVVFRIVITKKTGRFERTSYADTTFN